MILKFHFYLFYILTLLMWINHNSIYHLINLVVCLILFFIFVYRLRCLCKYHSISIINFICIVFSLTKPLLNSNKSFKLKDFFKSDKLFLGGIHLKKERFILVLFNYVLISSVSGSLIVLNIHYKNCQNSGKLRIFNCFLSETELGTKRGQIH